MTKPHLESTVIKPFIEGVRWPVDRTSLVALSDLGLDPLQIARYFSVTPREVVVGLMRSQSQSGTPAD